MDSKVDHLDEDLIKLSGQTYALISVVSPQSNQKHNLCGLKIRGVFATQEDAQHHASKLIKTDTTFDIYVVELYKWLPIPPNNELIDEHVHQEDMLQEIVKGHKDSQIAAKQHFADRQKMLAEQGSASGSSASAPVDPTDQTQPSEDTTLSINPQSDLDKGKGKL